MNNNEARSLGKEDKHSKVCKGYPNIKRKDRTPKYYFLVDRYASVIIK